MADQDRLITWATTVRSRDLNPLVRYWLCANDPDGAEPREQTARNGLTIRQLADGCIELRGRADPLVAAAIKTAISRFRRHVFDARQRIIETSRQRNFPKWMKHLLTIESRGKCSTPGCDAPFHWLHADHITPKTRGGPTAPNNGQTLCAPDNQWKADRDLPAA